MTLFPIETLGSATQPSPLRFAAETPHGGFIADNVVVRHDSEVMLGRHEEFDHALCFERFHDIGPHSKRRIVAHFEEIGQRVDLKYIDPSDIVSSAPANSEDALLCVTLARRAVDAAISGRTNRIIAAMNSSFVHVPVPMAIAGKRRVDIGGWSWNFVISSTGQPSQFRAPIS